MTSLETYLQEYKDWMPVWMEEDRVAFLSNRSGYMQIWELRMQTGEMRQRTHFKNTVLQLGVDGETRQLVFTVDLNGGENGQPFLLGFDEEDPRQVLDDPRHLHMLLGLGKDGTDLYYLSNAADGVVSDVVRFNLQTGKEEVLHHPKQPNAQPAGMSPDKRYVLYQLLSSFDENRLHCFDLETGAIALIPPDDRISAEVAPSWTADGRSIFVCTDRDRDRGYVARYSVDTKELIPVYYTESGECRRAALSPDQKYLAVAVEEEGYGHIDLVDAVNYTIIRTIEPIKAGLGATGLSPEYVTWSGDSRFVLFQVSNGTHPCRLWAYDVVDERSFQITFGGKVAQEDLVDMELREYHSFDGLRVPFFLLTPKQCKPGEKMPMLIEIHGGPECQSYCEYNAFLQYIVSRGIAIVVPNIRGSSGYGKSYCHLDDREKRLDSVRDIEYLVKHLIECENADPTRLAVSGASYGGFMTLSCCARLPEVWACAVDRVGMFNLQTFMENTAPYRRAWRASEYGSLEDGDLLFRVSPAAKADDIRTPMVVVHGDNDPRVPISETEQLVEMLRKKNVEVEFIRYADEGHGLTKYPNILDSYTKITTFLLKYLT